MRTTRARVAHAPAGPASPRPAFETDEFFYLTYSNDFKITLEKICVALMASILNTTPTPVNLQITGEF